VTRVLVVPLVSPRLAVCVVDTVGGVPGYFRVYGVANLRWLPAHGPMIVMVGLPWHRVSRVLVSGRLIRSISHVAPTFPLRALALSIRPHGWYTASTVVMSKTSTPPR
jgi:hypothetical protein